MQLYYYPCHSRFKWRCNDSNSPAPECHPSLSDLQFSSMLLLEQVLMYSTLASNSKVLLLQPPKDMIIGSHYAQLVVFLSKCFTVCLMPLPNFQRPNVVAFDSFVQQFWGRGFIELILAVQQSLYSSLMLHILKVKLLLILVLMWCIYILLCEGLCAQACTWESEEDYLLFVLRPT